MEFDRNKAVGIIAGASLAVAGVTLSEFSEGLKAWREVFRGDSKAPPAKVIDDANNAKGDPKKASAAGDAGKQTGDPEVSRKLDELLGEYESRAKDREALDSMKKKTGEVIQAGNNPDAKLLDNTVSTLLNDFKKLSETNKSEYLAYLGLLQKKIGTGLDNLEKSIIRPDNKDALEPLLKEAAVLRSQKDIHSKILAGIRDIVLEKS